MKNCLGEIREHADPMADDQCVSYRNISRFAAHHIDRHIKDRCLDHIPGPAPGSASADPQQISSKMLFCMAFFSCSVSWSAGCQASGLTSVIRVSTRSIPQSRRNRVHRSISAGSATRPGAWASQPRITSFPTSRTIRKKFRIFCFWILTYEITYDK